MTTTTEESFPGVPEPLRAAMLERGFGGLTPVQLRVLEAGAGGRNLRISSQTGSGKTVALGLVLAEHFLAPPAAPGQPAEGSRPGKQRQVRGPDALIITPTRELAVQVRDELAWLFSRLKGVSVAVVTGGTSVVGERRDLARAPRLLVGTPGRLLDHLRGGAFDASTIQHVVLDEADQMLDMGFREELEAIVDQLPAERRSHLVSATFPPQLRHLADRFQTNPLHVEGTRLGVANEDIEHIAYVVRPREAYAALVNLLLLGQGERCLVFVRRRVDASDLAEMLAGDGFSALPFSGELPQAQRTRTLNAFRSGTVNVLISTDVAARGIDVPDIATVIHGEPPTDAAVYTHRSGRTGRAGQKGRSLMLVPAQSRTRIDRLLREARVKAEWQPVPSPDKVKKALVKHARKELHALIDGARKPSDAELEYAKSLLEKADPVTLVATLLGMTERKLPREPMAVTEVPVGPEPRYGAAPRNGAAPRHGADSRGGPRDSRRPAQSPAQKRGFVRFHITWGQRNGATPARLLSHVCRRGGVSGQAIGSIVIEPRSAAFDVDADVAVAFEQKAKELDPREPGLRISRFRAEPRR